MFILPVSEHTRGVFSKSGKGAIYAELIDKLWGEGDQTVEGRPLGLGPHVLGLRTPGHYLRMVFQFGRRNSRYRRRHGSGSHARRACVSHVGQGLLIWQSLPAPRRHGHTEEWANVFDGTHGSRLAHVKAVPRTTDLSIGINELRGISPLCFRVQECERGLKALSAYHTVRDIDGHSARQPCHDASSHT